MEYNDSQTLKSGFLRRAHLGNGQEIAVHFLRRLAARKLTRAPALIAAVFFEN